MREIGTDQDAFEAFYREHLDFVRKYVARCVDDAHTAADLTADIFLAAIDGLSLADSAAVLGITAANARTRYHRARTRLRSALPTTLCEVPS